MIYSDSGSVNSFVNVRDETTRAKTDYDKAQEALITFIAHSQKDELKRQILEVQTIIDSLSNARNTAVNTIVDEQTKAQLDVVKEYYNAQAQNQLLALQRDQDGRRQLITSYIDALLSTRQKVFTEQVQDLETNLEQAYLQRRQVSDLLGKASDMRDQVKSGGSGAAASNALALTLLKAQVFVSNQDLGNLQIQAGSSTISAEAMVADLNGLISTLRARLKILDKQIQTLSESSLNTQA